MDIYVDTSCPSDPNIKILSSTDPPITSMGE
jgi:hypothetical protein